MISSGRSKKVLPQLAGSTMIIFQSLPHRLLKTVRTLSANTYGWTPLLTSYLVSTCQPLTFTNAVIFLVGFFYQVHPAHISSLDFFRSSLWPFCGGKQVTQWFLQTWQQKVGKVFFALFFLCMCNRKQFVFIADFVASDVKLLRRAILGDFVVVETWSPDVSVERDLCFCLTACTHTLAFKKLISCMLGWLELR